MHLTKLGLVIGLASCVACVAETDVGEAFHSLVPPVRGFGAPGVLRETDVELVGGDFAPRRPIVVTAAGTGAQVELQSWLLLEDAPPEQSAHKATLPGHDVVLHALRRDDDVPPDYVILLTGAIHDDLLWLTTWRTGRDGQLTQLDTRGYGYGGSHAIEAFDIAHRLTDESPASPFLVVTPVRMPAGVQMVSWTVDATTGAIAGTSASGMAAGNVDLNSPVRVGYVRGGSVPEYFVVATRELGDELRHHFYGADNAGVFTAYGSALTSTSITGLVNLTEATFSHDVTALTDNGMLAAIERPGGAIDLISYDNRVECGAGGCEIVPYRIGTEEFDLEPAHGVEVPLPQHVARGTTVLDAQHDVELYSTCGHLVQGVASVTKAMTLRVALDEVLAGGIDLDVVDVEISSLAANVGGSEVGFEEGEVHSLRTLFKGLMTQSGNDAAVAIAERISGSVEKFVARMVEEAAVLGLSESFYCHPAGGCYSTPADQTRLWSAMRDRDDFQSFSGSLDDTGCGEKSDGTPICYNFVRAPIYPATQSWKDGNVGFFCPSIPETDGLDLCSGCRTAQAERLDRTLIATLLQPQGVLPALDPDTRALFNYGYTQLYTPDRRGANVVYGLGVQDFGLAQPSADYAVASIIDKSDQLRLCSWRTNVAEGTFGAEGCQVAKVGALAASTHQPLPNEVEITLASRIGADGNYLVAQREGTSLHLSAWQLGTREPTPFAEEACCGNGIREPGEDCDGDDFGSASCGDFGYTMGSLGCSALCTIETTGCEAGTSPVPPGSYGDCGYDLEACDGSPSGCDAVGDCLGGPCQRTNPSGNPLDPSSGYHPDGDFVDAEGNLYFCPDSEGEEWVCVDEDGWGVCRRCADAGEHSTRLGCACDLDQDCEGNEPGLGCFGADSGEAPGFATLRPRASRTGSARRRIVEWRLTTRPARRLTVTTISATRRRWQRVSHRAAPMTCSPTCARRIVASAQRRVSHVRDPRRIVALQCAMNPPTAAPTWGIRQERSATTTNASQGARASSASRSVRTGTRFVP